MVSQKSSHIFGGIFGTEKWAIIYFMHVNVQGYINKSLQFNYQWLYLHTDMYTALY